MDCQPQIEWGHPTDRNLYQGCSKVTVAGGVEAGRNGLRWKACQGVYKAAHQK